MRSVANGAGDFANGHLRGGIAKTRDVALIFREPIGDFQTERYGLGMHTVRAADLGSVVNMKSPENENFAERGQGALEEERSVPALQSLRGIDHVVGGHA